MTAVSISADAAYWVALARHRDDKLTKREWEHRIPATNVHPVEVKFVECPGEFAKTVRWAQGEIPLEIHENKDGTYSAMPPEDLECEDRYDGIRADDLQLYGLNLTHVAEQLADIFALIGMVKQVAPHLWLLGDFESLGKRSEYYLSLHRKQDDIDVPALGAGDKKRFVLCPRSDADMFSALAGSGLTPLNLSELPIQRLVERTYPRSILWNDVPFEVWLPVQCRPAYHPELPLDQLFGPGDPRPPASEVADLCELVLIGEEHTLTIYVQMDHPQRVIPDTIISRPLSSKKDRHVGRIRLNGQMAQARNILISPTEEDQRVLIELEKACRQKDQTGLTPIGTEDSPRGCGGSKFALIHGVGGWQLIFEGIPVYLGSFNGIAMVAYLIQHCELSPIHAIELEARSYAYFFRRGNVPIKSVVPDIADEDFPSDAFLQERNLAVDSAETEKALVAEEKRLQQIIKTSDSDTERHAAAKSIQAIAKFRLVQYGLDSNPATRCARRVRAAIQRLIDELVNFDSRNGDTKSAASDFAGFINDAILTPSRHLWPSGGRSKQKKIAGHFVYKRQEGMEWDIR
jgi:hypothetical protein